jgi:anti-sigma regulatory factor (Ser/Thr protein kinase)
MARMLDQAEGFSEAYPAIADSVPSARSALTEFAAEAGAKGERLEAIRLAASEAITNGVVHAYRGSRGSIHVAAAHTPGELWVLIGDDGTGLRPRGPHSGLGLGLALIAQLADEFEILSRSSGGTELRMQFKLGDGTRPAGRACPERDQVRGSTSSAFAPA